MTLQISRRRQHPITTIPRLDDHFNKSPEAREANGSQWPCEGPLAFGRYYAGGFRSMRGFEFRGVGPDINGFKAGGDSLFLNSAEYQIPVRANDQIYRVSFIDLGTVESRTELEDYRVSAGVGARIVVPMLGPVPIALDSSFGRSTATIVPSSWPRSYKRRYRNVR